MSRVAALYDLQKVDLELDAKAQRLQQITEALGETEVLRGARALVEEAKTRLAEIEGRRQELEWEVERLNNKIESLEKKLYSGTVTNLKELSGLQRDVESLKAHRSTIEDQLLDVLEQIDSSQGELQAKQRDFDLIERDWRQAQSHLLTEQEALRADQQRLQVERSQRASVVDAQALTLYESLRSAKGGRPVARLEQGTCQGCRISLPTTEVQRARNSDLLVQCSSCKRILYVG